MPIILIILWVAIFLIFAAYDWRSRRIPNALIALDTVLVLSIWISDLFVGTQIITRPMVPVNALVSGLLAALLYAIPLLIAFFTLKIGAGDIKYSALIGLVLGFPAVIFAVLTTAITFSIWVLLMIRRGKSENFKLPYGVFLSAGAIIAILLPDSFLRLFV